ncbi:DHA2 family efflux MFS transporter permease subunit [Conexibacter sp. CPCC 206217]|uniref:DHA2 family efflux MFS transporter permease subunit n=1 Tax=Conexibacter sp. CPCC 206217 TaxID=3064574 RepID=UPI00271595C4|nr:DHA2 family efflux MFS transporter permease subunit [Conexibacter sp. CPCC 206217]MDO8209458.1 DHA2 family efflux MFS transporter permease subunit [Conexibacter sp. CPCC 206217]
MTAATTESAPAAPAAPAVSAGHPRRWLILFVVLAVECMDLLDGTIVNVAAPSIGAELHASTTALQWIVGGYALALAVGLVLGGRLGDLFGRRRLFLIGTAAFTVCSLLCGVAPSSGVLIAFRLLQGLAAALMIPQGFGIIRSAFSTEELPKAFGLFGPVIGLSAVLGPIVGGALVDADLFGTGWRLVFLVNLPLGIVAVAAGIALLPESRTDGVSNLDGVGAALVALAVGLLIYPLIQGRELDWPAWTFAMMAASGVLLIVFGWHERRRERAGRDPLVTTSIFAKRAYTSGLLVMLLFFAGMVGLMLVLTLYLQLGLGFSAIHAGLSLAPQSLGMAIGAGLGGALLAPRFGRKVLHAGLVVMAIGTVALLLVVDANGLDVTTWQLAVPQLVAGVGIGLVVAPLFSLVLAAVADDEVGSASGVLNALQQLGSAVGIALLGTLFFTTLDSQGFVDALEHVLIAELAVIAAAAVLALLLPQQGREEELH